MLPLALLAVALPQAPSCLRVVGDVTLARGVGEELARSGRSPWEAFAREPRLWVGNLEGAVAPPQGQCDKPPALCLGMRAADLRALATAPFLAVSLANNHALDFGPAGLAATRGALAQAGVGVIDEAPLYLELGGRRVAWIGVELAARGLEARTLALEALRLSVLRARAEADLVVVLPHWGEEGEAEPDQAQRELGERLLAWGAGLVAGAHAHVPQGARCTAEGAVYYGLGNHLFDQPARESREGWMLDCCPEGQGLRCAVRTSRRSERSTYPTPGDAAPGEECLIRWRPPADLRFRAHPHAAELVTVEPFPPAGDGAFFALVRSHSSFDHALALRPYVFEVRGGQVIDRWRGTALAWPLVGAHVVLGPQGALLCAIHRDDSFLRPHPATLGRRRGVYGWTGFGFREVKAPEAQALCARAWP